MKLVILSLVMTFLSSCCDKNLGEPLVIENNTDNRIYYWFAYWKIENYTKYHYPDTILPIQFPIEISSIAPNNAIADGEGDPNWEEIFNDLPDRKFSIYFFTNEPKAQIDWDSIRNGYDLYRKDVTLEELVEANYRISYP